MRFSSLFIIDGKKRLNFVDYCRNRYLTFVKKKNVLPKTLLLNDFFSTDNKKNLKII